jgi:hypothetical protein
MKRELQVIVAVIALAGIVVGTTLIVSNWYDKSRLGPMMQQLGQQGQELNAKEIELNKLRTDKEAEIATLRGEIDSAYTEISQLNTGIETLVAMDEEKSKELEKLLTEEVGRLIEVSPALKTYVFTLLEQLRGKDAIIFSLTKKDQEKDVIISALGKQILAEREIGLSWKRQQENERSLRLATENAFRVYRKAQKAKRMLYSAVGAGLGFLGGAILN